MSATVKDAIAAELELLERVVETPTGPLGYGVDLSCVTDVTDDLAEVDPESPQGIVEAVMRRYQTPRGSLADDGDYGLDVRGLLNRGTDVQTLARMQRELAGEAGKDDRVAAAAATVDMTFAPTSLRITVLITPADPALQPFTMTLVASSTTVILEAIR